VQPLESVIDDSKCWMYVDVLDFNSLLRHTVWNRGCSPCEPILSNLCTSIAKLLNSWHFGSSLFYNMFIHKPRD